MFMNRRRFNTLSSALLAASCLGVTAKAHALSLNELTNAQASQGLKLALEKGAMAAVKSLGQPNGFLGNDRVRIPLPGVLEDAGKLLRTLGQGARLDELIVAMNHAAEAAVPLARDMLVGAVKSMNVQDAKKILTGGENSVTQFFAENQLAGKAAGLGLLKGDQVSIEQYVTAKSLDGLYLMIAEEEKKIRQDPVGTGSAVLQKVFGALRP